MSLFYPLVARGGRKRGTRWTDRPTDTRTDKPSTVTLAAHTRRGLTSENDQWLTSPSVSLFKIHVVTLLEEEYLV